MNFKQIFSAFFALMLAASQPLSAQCVGVHVTSWWDCPTGTANAFAQPEGGFPPYTYLWDNGDTNQSTSGLQPGQHHITVTDNTGCLHVEACVIIVPECCMWATITSTPDDCHTGNNGQGVIWQIGGGIAPYTISLPDSTTKVTNGNTPVFINNLAAGVYYITITDASGCSIEQPIEIEQQASPTVTLHANALTCNETTTTINTQVSNGPVSFLWNTGATTATLPNVGPGTYTVKVTNANGCSDSDTIVISAPQQVTLHASATPTACGENNGSLTLTSGPWPIVVEAPNGAIFNLVGPSATIDSLQSGVYTATVTNGAGCTMVESAIIADSDPAQNEFECVSICGAQFVNGVLVSTDTTITDTLTNTNGCKYILKTMVTVQTADTTYETVNACYGDVVTVGGNTYSESTTVSVPTSGDCPGLTIWTIAYSDAPDSISLPPVKICGGDSLQTYTFTNVMGADCPELKVYRSFVHQPYTLEFELTTTETICGLGARTDSLFRPIHVDNVNCKITQPFGLLVTNVPTTTITPGPTHFICGTPADSTWVETSDITDIANCSRNITGYWSVTTPQPILHRDTITTCFPAIAAQYPKFHEGVDCNPDTLVVAVLEQKPEMAILFKDTCNYSGPLPIAPVQILHPGNNCLSDTMIIVNPHYQVNTYGNETLCFGDTIHLDGVPITTEGDYSVFVGQTIHGCDSIKTVHVTMVFGSKFETDQDTCDLTVAGQKFWKTTTSPNGCVDSILVTLKWLPGFEKDSTFFTCRKQDAFCHSDTIQENGCWGIVHYGANYFPNTFSEVAYTCDSLQAGYTVKAWLPADPNDPTDCDSIVWLHKVYREIKPTVLNPVALCPGESHEFEGQIYFAPPAGEFLQLSKTYTTSEGCDSTVLQTITGLTQENKDTLVYVCNGEEFYFTPADTFLTTGVYVFNLPVPGSCDMKYTITVASYTDELFGFVPDSLVLSAPEGMNLSSVDQWITGLASGDWLGSIHNGVWTMVREDLFFVGSTDSTAEYLQAWVIQGPCGKMEFSRPIFVNLYQEDEPTGPICDIKIITPLSGDMSITVNSIPGKTITNVQAWIFNLGTGKLEMMPIVGLGFNPISGATLPHGATFALRMTAQIDGKTRTLWNEEGPILHKFERM